MADKLTSEEVMDIILNAEWRFGLVAQGHLPTIATAINEGKTLKEIAILIGWDEEAFRRHLAWYIEDSLRKV